MVWEMNSKCNFKIHRFDAVISLKFETATFMLSLVERFETHVVEGFCYGALSVEDGESIVEYVYFHKGEWPVLASQD